MGFLAGTSYSLEMVLGGTAVNIRGISKGE